ncbi:MAG TPA: T9SS type A sorting domain-containing protein, partial [Bacteroidia bacterium]
NVNIQESGSPNALYRIDGNDFSDRQSGIYLNGLFNANITDNTINIASNNSNGSTFTSGIWNYNCKSCLFSGNNISSTNPNSNNSKYYVVGIFTDGSNGNTYCSNAISKVGECMKFQQNCLPSNIYSNSFNASGPSAINAILLQTAVVGNIGVSSGTTWYASENIFGNFSFPEVYSVTSPGATYYDITSPTFGGSTLYVFGLTSKIPGGPVCPSATFRLNSDSLPHHPPVFDPSAKDYLKEEYYIARMYEQYRHILPDSVMNACAAGNIGKFFVADSLMQLYVNSKDLSYLAQANAVNSSVVPQNVIESNQVRLNNILQSYLLNESAAMAGYLDDLRVLAQKCPATDGNCVYQARALLSVYDRTEYTSECERGSEISTNNNSSVDGNVHVYPNPASNEVFVNVSKEGLKIEVYNILGVKVSSYVLAQGENKLDVSKLSSGTYFFKVMDSSSLVKVEKVIIDHQ